VSRRSSKITQNNNADGQTVCGILAGVCHKPNMARFANQPNNQTDRQPTTTNRQQLAEQMQTSGALSLPGK